MISNLNNYSNNNNTNYRQNYINNINSMSNNINEQLNKLYYPKTTDEVQDLNSSIISFKHSVSKLNSNMQKDYDELTTYKNTIEDDLKKLRNYIKSQEEKLENINNSVQNIITDFNEKFRNSQDSRNEEFKKKIEEYNIELDTTINKWGEQFEELYNSTEENVEDIEKQYEEKFKKLTDTINDKANKYITTFDQKISEIEKIIGAVSSQAHSHEYKNYAIEDKKSKQIWQFLTVIGLVGLIGFAILASYYAYENQTNINWSIVVTKWFVAFAFGSFATYAGKQASNYYNSEKNNRKMELELATLNPYLNGLDEKEINRIKSELVHVFFGNISPPKNNTANIRDQEIDEQILREFIDGIKTVAALNKINN